MPGVTTIKFGQVPFAEAIEALRAYVAMDYEEFKALSAAAKQRAFSFADATTKGAARQLKDVLTQALVDPVRGDFMERANAVLDAYGISLTPHQAELIFETNLARAFNDGMWVQIQKPEIRAIRPYVGWVAVGDARTRPNHFALDWRRIKTVFAVDDWLWSQMKPPAGYRCRCHIDAFSEEELVQFGLTVGKGADWYGRPVEVTVPGAGTRVVQVLPDPGWGGGTLTAKRPTPEHPTFNAQRSTLNVVELATMIVALRAVRHGRAA